MGEGPRSSSGTNGPRGRTTGGVGASAIVMSGGIESTPGDGYRYHTFLSSDTLTVTSGGSVEYLVVAGGGGGGGRASASTNTGGGGGGAGGLLSGTQSITATQTITVGAGGSGSGDLVDPTNGTGSSIGALVTTDGGGAGDSGSNGGGAALRDDQDGGSGGGGGDNGASGGYVGLGGTATAGQGNDGGDSFGTTSGNEQAGGGGGGAGAAGQDAPALRIAGDGGAGAEWPASSGTYYAGGGGGGNAWVNMSAGASAGDGGIGGGGKGDDSLGGGSAAADGTANTGGGGGGSGRSANGGGDGGSGIVVVRYSHTQVGDNWRDLAYDYWEAGDARSGQNLASANGIIGNLPVDVAENDGFYLTGTTTFASPGVAAQGVFAVVKAVGSSVGNQIPDVATLNWPGGWRIDVSTDWVGSSPYEYGMRSESSRAGVAKSTDRDLLAGEIGIITSGKDGGDARTFIAPDSSATEEWTGTGFSTDPGQGGGPPDDLVIGSLRESGHTNLRFLAVGVLTARPTQAFFDALKLEYGVS